MVGAQGTSKIIVLNTPSNSGASGKGGGTGAGGFRPLMLTGIIVCVFLGSHITRNQLQRGHRANNTAPSNQSCQRIIALSPSMVEIIYGLGLEARLVGVSRYANYPPQAKTKPSVGGYLDLHMEKVLSLDPDCILLLKEQEELSKRMHRLGIHTITVDHGDTKGILESIHTIGKGLGAAGRADDLLRAIQTRIRQLNSTHPDIDPKPRVLICISRDLSAKHLQQVIIAGSAGYHRELVGMAGGVNAYEGSIPFPSLSREKLIALQPDFIIDLVNTETWHKIGKERLLAPWYALREMKAVSNRRVFILHGDQHMIPGPRFPDTLEQITRAIHP